MNTTSNPPTHQAEGHTKEQEAFLTCVRTLTLTKTRLKGIDDNDFVHLGQREIEERFFKWPSFSREKEIKKLIKDGSLIKKKQYNPKSGRMMDMYICLRHGALDASLVPVKVPVYGKTQSFMLECLKNTVLEPGTPTTMYFDFFIQSRDQYPNLFFKFDSFSGRCHTPVTSLPGSIRENLLLYGKPVVSLDVSQMQPQILGVVLKDQIKENQFSTWMDSRADVYRMIAGRYGLDTRAEGKKRFFEILFGRANDELAVIFGEADWITWINRYKRRKNTGNPHMHKLHSNLAWLLQKKEVEIMKTVWIDLTAANIPFLTVHDEIICSRENKEAATKIFKEKLEQHFVHFQLNVS